MYTDCGHVTWSIKPIHQKYSKSKFQMHTCIVFPFLALTTSPGLFALPLGIFSHRGAKPQREKEKYITGFLLRKEAEKKYLRGKKKHLKKAVVFSSWITFNS